MAKSVGTAMLCSLWLSAGIAGAAQDGSATLADAVSWLEKESHRIIRASRRTMKDGTAAFPPQVGIGYEAFWLRDYVYTLEGSIEAYSDKELSDACRLFVRSLRSDGAGVDCVGFDGTPVYMPGYGTMGRNPVADGSQFTVAVVWHTYQRTRDRSCPHQTWGRTGSVSLRLHRHDPQGGGRAVLLAPVCPGEPATLGPAELRRICDRRGALEQGGTARDDQHSPGVLGF